VILSTAETDTSEPIDLFVWGCVIIDFAFMVLLIAKFFASIYEVSYTVKQSIRLAEGSVSLVYIGWQVTGNIWFYSCGDCFSEAPELSGLALGLIVLGYIYLCTPLFFFCCLCTCLPVLLVVLFFLNRGTRNPASETLLRSLKTEEFDSSVHTRERSCPICSEDFSNRDSIVVLPCQAGHYFHETCGKRWLQVNATCPLCREDLMSEN